MTPVINLDGYQPLLPEPGRAAVPDELHDDLAADLPGPREVYRWAIQRGWSTAAAGNWAAFSIGLHVVAGGELLDRPWTLREVQHLAWMRWLVQSGRAAEDMAAAR